MYFKAGSGSAPGGEVLLKGFQADPIAEGSQASLLGPGDGRAGEAVGAQQLAQEFGAGLGQLSKTVDAVFVQDLADAGANAFDEGQVIGGELEGVSARFGMGRGVGGFGGGMDGGGVEVGDQASGDDEDQSQEDQEQDRAGGHGDVLRSGFLQEGVGLGEKQLQHQIHLGNEWIGEFYPKVSGLSRLRVSLPSCQLL